MPKFIIEASERVFYYKVVEANSIEDVQAIADAGEIDWGEPVDGEDFTVDDIRPDDTTITIFPKDEDNGY